MEYFVPVALTPSQRPVPLTEEVDIRNLDNVSVHLQNDKTICGDLFVDVTLILTNFRIILIVRSPSSSKTDNNCVGWGLFLKDIDGLEDCSTFFSRSKRVKINFIKKRAVNDLGFKFNMGDKEDFIEKFNRVYAKKSWEKVTRMMATDLPNATNSNEVNHHRQDPEGFSSSNAGISGIIRRQEKVLQSADAFAKSAMTDLDTLIDQARDVVSIVQRYAAYMQETREKKENGDDVSETSTQVAEENEMERIMQSIGIVSPVTRLSAGRLYHEQLARQLADMLNHHNRLQRLGGMINLTDLYCIYNKARGTELVSPHDLLCACEKIPVLKLGLKLRIFPSGVKVMELDNFDEDGFCKRLVDLINSAEFGDNGISASHVSVHFGYSLIIAKEKLLIAEKRQFLCRDESIRGLYFFQNKFSSFVS
jgi:ESCRT-II complex subunit VPS36